MEPGNVKAYAEALVHVYHMTDEERRLMAEKGRKEIKEKYSYSLLAKKYMKIFEEVWK